MSYEKSKVIDRIYINKEEYLEFMDYSYIFGLNNHNIDRKDQILFAIALGYKMGRPTPVPKKGKKDIVLTKYFKEEDMALLYAVAYDTTKDINIISESVEKLNKVYELAEGYANTGLSFLKSFEENCSYENHLKKFEKKINDYINELKED